MTMSVQCCIAGGGPAGMMLGLLLARAGVRVAVLEKHRDFLRDFRGDTIHPSTLELMHELGYLDEFLALPHQRVPEIEAQIGATALRVADFTHLPVRAPFIALMPQWDFLDFLADKAKAYPGFSLLMESQVQDLLFKDGRVTGVRATTPQGPVDIESALVVGADGRHSTVRERAGLPVVDLGAPIDVLWFRLSRRAGDPEATMGRFDRGRIVVMLNRGDYWQCAFVIGKGSADALRAGGLDAFRASLAAGLPLPAQRAAEIASWDDVKLLTVQVNRMTTWYREGLLCIGDAAHAMSPVGGVGINLALQDAVAAANLLWQPLRQGAAGLESLRKVQERRELPTRLTQRFQVLVQRFILQRILGEKADGEAALRPPLPVRLLGRYPRLRRIPARMIGLGVRPEHIASPAMAP
jgi:2-polyprenyl-6-methoxyphenol hydroxylase-like FAD-dependent oxidoreductase